MTLFRGSPIGKWSVEEVAVLLTWSTFLLDNLAEFLGLSVFVREK